jgi:hypothetical protein
VRSEDLEEELVKLNCSCCGGEKEEPEDGNLCTDSECGSAESTTKQSFWKADDSGWEDDELRMPGKAVWVSSLTMWAARFTKVAARPIVGLSERVSTMKESLVPSCMSLW